MAYRIDLFAVFIFLGIVQAVFLSFFFLTGENRKVQANVFQGILLLAMAACILEIFLMYTGLIMNCLYLVDFSETAAFLIGPCFYLATLSTIRGSLGRRYYIHFVIPALYLIYHTPFLLMGEDVKYNAYIGAYHPNLPYREVTDDSNYWGWIISEYHSEMIILSVAFYGVLEIIAVVKAFRAQRESLLNTVHPVLRRIRAGVLQSIIVLFMIVVVKIFNEDDTGDHMFAAYIAFAIYMMSFNVMRSSGAFKPSSLAPVQKYRSSAVSPEIQENLLKKLRDVMEKEKPFRSSDFSLPDLARQLGTSVHTLSQVINDGLKKNFFEMVADYRIAEAQLLLREQPNIKIEEIAEQVGYNSKSSFNTAFKKITGRTPSAFRSE